MDDPRLREIKYVMVEADILLCDLWFRSMTLFPSEELSKRFDHARERLNKAIESIDG